MTFGHVENIHNVTLSLSVGVWVSAVEVLIVLPDFRPGFLFSLYLPCSVLCLDKLIMNKTTKIPAFRFNGKGQITAKKIHNTTFNSTESYKKIIEQRRLETVAVGNSLIVLSYR